MDFLTKKEVKEDERGKHAAKLSTVTNTDEEGGI